MTTNAQEYFNLTAQEVKIDSLLPVFTYARPLGQHYSDSIYTVSIEYPEFMAMSADDVRRYEQISGAPLPALPDVVQQISISRKQATLEVSLIPLVWREGKYQKLVSFQLKVQATARNGQRAPRLAPWETTRSAATSSVLATGKWAKIRVPSTGVYQLTNDLIQRAGFSNINNVRVYGYGGAMQPEKLYASYIDETDDLKEVPLCTTNGQRLFWAQGPVSWNGKDRIRNPYHGGRNLYDAYTFTIGQARDYTLASAAAGGGTVTIVLTAYDSNKSSTATVSVNGETVGTLSIGASSTYNHASQTKSIFKVSNLSTTNTIRIQQTGGGIMRLDYIAIHADGATSAPTLQSIKAGTPEFVGTVTNQNLHGDEATDMVIIIPESKKLQKQAERLKTFHEEKDGLRVRLLTADELYNEFSSGTPDANAYRRYLRMLYERAASEADMPRYLLLFGDGAWDNRMLSPDWSSTTPSDFLLCYESENSFSNTDSYVTDDYFCLLDDGEGGNLLSSDRSDVAVGRFPVRTEAEAKIMVDKVISYANNTYAGSWQNEICMMGDDGNNNLHMQDADAVARLVEQLHPEYQVKRIMWDAYERVTSATGNSYPDVTRLIKQQMQSGALIMNYCGHGAAYSFSHELVMQLNDFSEAVSTRLPLWVTASCDIMPFDGQEDNIGETAVLNKRGGAVSFYGTTRTVYSSYNRMMNLAFMRQALSGVATGEAVRLTKNSLIITSQDLTTNKLQYTLLGDPALHLAYPTLQAVVDDINGASVKEGDPLVLRSGTTVTVRGHIEQNGVRQSSYNGTVTATVRDAEETITCRLNDTSLNSEDFTNGDKVNLTPYFVARISDDNGINATGNGIGHDIQLIIDGMTSQTYVLNDYFSYDFGSYTEGMVGFSIPTLTAGKHKLQFRVWDTQNNSTTKELSFEVVESLEPVFFDVECTRNPAETTTSFRIIHDRTGSEMDVILDIFDMSGRHLWQHSETGVPTDNTYMIDWDLTSGGGSRVSTGVYLYRVRISSNGSSYASKTKKLIVISNK